MAYNNKSIIGSTSSSSSIANRNVELSSKSIHRKVDSVKLLPEVTSSLSSSKEVKSPIAMNSDKVKIESDIKKDTISNVKNIESTKKSNNQLNKIEAVDSKSIKEKVRTKKVVVKDGNNSLLSLTSNNHPPKSIGEIKIPTLYSLKRASKILKPLWQCKERNKQGKLIFVHIFKTAGSTMRSLFRLYSQYCAASSVTVVSCSSLTEESIRDGKKKWKKLHGGPCIFKAGKTRSGESILPERTYINTTYIQSNVDVLGGHIPLGSLDTLNQHNNQTTGNKPTTTTTPLLYFLFVRNAMQKFISGKMFSNRHDEDLGLEEIVIMIKKHVRRARKNNEYYQNYASYLITPYQRHLVLDRNSRTQLILNNLVNYKVIIGVVDRMSESLELLHHVIDSKQEMNSLFQHYGMGDTEGKRKDKVMHNKSKFSTSSILTELKKDVDFFPLMVEYVKYDQMIVDFATKIHLLQYKAL